MSLFKKSLLVFLVILNVIFFAWTFISKFQTQTSYSYSATTQENAQPPDASLNSKIENQCGEELKKVIKGDSTEFICDIDREHNQQGSYYKLKTKIILQRHEDNKIKILGTGAMRNKTRYALEADFCEDCKEVKRVEGQDMQTILQQVFDVAQVIQSKAKNSVDNAKQRYVKKDLARRSYKIKESLCLGEWDSDAEEFLEYDSEDMLNCKLLKLTEKNIFEKEKFYHSDLKTDLWLQALSDEEFLLSDSLQRLKTQHFPHTLSVLNSANLLEKYLQWKTSFKTSGLVDETKSALQQIVNEASKLSATHHELNTDLNFLLESSHYQEMQNATAQLNQPAIQPVPVNPSPSVVPTQHYNLPSNIKDQTRHLYD